MSLPRFRTKITGPKQVSVSATSAPHQRFQLKWQGTAALSVERRKAVASQGTLSNLGHSPVCGAMPWPGKYSLMVSWLTDAASTVISVGATLSCCDSVVRCSCEKHAVKRSVSATQEAGSGGVGLL
jgi:hypothetical protein